MLTSACHVHDADTTEHEFILSLIVVLYIHLESLTLVTLPLVYFSVDVVVAIG